MLDPSTVIETIQDKVDTQTLTELYQDPFKPGFMYWAPFPFTLRNRFKLFECKTKSSYFCHEECDEKNCPGFLKDHGCDVFKVGSNKRKALNTIIGTKIRPILILGQASPCLQKKGVIEPMHLIVAPIKSIKDKFTTSKIFLDLLKSKGLNPEELKEEQVFDIILDPSVPFFWKVPDEVNLNEPSFVDLTDVDQIAANSIAKVKNIYIPYGVLNSKQLDEVNCKFLDLLNYQLALPS